MQIMSSYRDNGAFILQFDIRLFKDTPRLQKVFVKFAAVPMDALTSNAEFSKQVKLVADRLDNMISSMDDTLQIVGEINYMAYSHVPREVGRQQFEVSVDFVINRNFQFDCFFNYFLKT